MPVRVRPPCRRVLVRAWPVLGSRLAIARLPAGVLHLADQSAVPGSTSAAGPARSRAGRRSRPAPAPRSSPRSRACRTFPPPTRARPPPAAPSTAARPRTPPPAAPRARPPRAGQSRPPGPAAGLPGDHLSPRTSGAGPVRRARRVLAALPARLPSPDLACLIRPGDHETVAARSAAPSRNRPSGPGGRPGLRDRYYREGGRGQLLPQRRAGRLPAGLAHDLPDVVPPPAIKRALQPPRRFRSWSPKSTGGSPSSPTRWGPRTDLPHR